MLQTEFEFTLPCGYIDAHGNLHRQGTMRLATALDEVEPLQDVRVRVNETGQYSHVREVDDGCPSGSRRRRADALDAIAADDDHLIGSRLR